MFRTAPVERQFVAREIQKMLQEEVLEPVNTVCTSHIVFLLNKDGALRFFVDSRRLNAITVRDS